MKSKKELEKALQEFKVTINPLNISIKVPGKEEKIYKPKLSKDDKSQEWGKHGWNAYLIGLKDAFSGRTRGRKCLNKKQIPFYEIGMKEGHSYDKNEEYSDLNLDEIQDREFEEYEPYSPTDEDGEIPQINPEGKIRIWGLKRLRDKEFMVSEVDFNLLSGMGTIYFADVKVYKDIFEMYGESTKYFNEVYKDYVDEFIKEHTLTKEEANMILINRAIQKKHSYWEELNESLTEEAKKFIKNKKAGAIDDMKEDMIEEERKEIVEKLVEELSNEDETDEEKI